MSGEVAAGGAQLTLTLPWVTLYGDAGDRPVWRCLSAMVAHEAVFEPWGRLHGRSEHARPNRWTARYRIGFPDLAPPIPDTGEGGPTWLPRVPDVQINIPRIAPDYTWNDVGRWFSDAWSPIENLFSSAQAGLSAVVRTFVTDMITTVINQVNTVLGTLGGLISASSAWFTTWITTLTDVMTQLSRVAFNAIDDVHALVDALAGDVYGILVGEIPQIWDTIRGIEATIYGLPGFILGKVYDGLTGVIEGVVDPAIAGVKDWVQGILGEVVAGIEAWVNDLLDARVAAILAALAALAARVAALEATADECVQGMCDTMGPNTNLGKLFKTLEALLGGAIVVGLLGLKESDLERIGAAIASVAAGDLDAFMRAFVEGGETLGSAGGQLLGDVAGLGAQIAGELGIPGL